MVPNHCSGYHSLRGLLAGGQESKISSQRLDKRIFTFLLTRILENAIFSGKDGPAPTLQGISYTDKGQTEKDRPCRIKIGSKS